MEDHKKTTNEARQTEILRLIKKDPDAYFESVRRSEFGFRAKAEPASK